MIGTAIKLMRNSLGISASELARKAGIARSHLWRLERGEERPGYDVLCRIARLLHLRFPVVPDRRIARIGETAAGARGRV
jgi:transcriptional regulator with XRE-family HTH domain